MTNLNEVAERAVLIAKALGPSWSVGVDDDIQHGAHIRDSAEGRDLWAYVEYYGAQRGRLVIRAHLPRAPHVEGRSNDVRSVWGRLTEREITVAGDKDPAKIAADITRRLLPGYDEDRATVLANIAARDADDRSRAATSARLRAACPALQECRDQSLRWYPEGPGYGDVTVSSGGETVSVHLRMLPADVAAELLQLLAERVK